MLIHIYLSTHHRHLKWHFIWSKPIPQTLNNAISNAYHPFYKEWWSGWTNRHMVVRDCSYFYIVGRFYPNNRITFMSRNINEDDFIINTNNVIVVKIQLYLSNYHKYLTICLMVDPTKRVLHSNYQQCKQIVYHVLWLLFKWLCTYSTMIVGIILGYETASMILMMRTIFWLS